jgi:hypothetical protein
MALDTYVFKRQITILIQNAIIIEMLLTFKRGGIVTIRDCWAYQGL